MKERLLHLTVGLLCSFSAFSQWKTSADGTTQETPQDVSIADGNILLTNVGANRGAIDLFDQDNAEYLRLYSSGGDGYIRMVGGNPKGIRFFPGNTESVYFSANGRVGIGTANPEASMDIRRAGTIGGVWGPERAYLQLSDGTVSMIMDGNEITTNNALYFGANRGFRFMKVEEQSNTALLEIKPDGKIGIGTTTPDSKLTVAGHVNVGGAGNAWLKARHINGKHWQNSGDHELLLNYHTGYAVKVGFGQKDANLLVSGNVGIGTTDPQARLDVAVGNVHFDNGFGLTSDAGASITTGSGGQTFAIQPGASGNIAIFKDGQGVKRVTIDPDGNLGIGTANPTSKLTVDGDILATKVKVVTDVASVPDYVFADDYDLSSLDEVADFIQANQHLPEVPSAAEMAASGQDLGEMNLLLLKKIEELTLYLIELNSKVESQAMELKLLKNQ